jgi:heme-degrading monooxygenase HmoA
MTAIVVFRVRVRAEVGEAYAAASQRMEELVREQPGFLDMVGWVDPETGEEITIVQFVDDAAVKAWRDQPEHVEVRRRGHDEFYESFDISVATSVRQYEWTRTDA